jgi:hypothetical protein
MPDKIELLTSVKIFSPGIPASNIINIVRPYLHPCLPVLEAQTHARDYTEKKVINVWLNKEIVLNRAKNGSRSDMGMSQEQLFSEAHYMAGNVSEPCGYLLELVSTSVGRYSAYGRMDGCLSIAKEEWRNTSMYDPWFAWKSIKVFLNTAKEYYRAALMVYLLFVIELAIASYLWIGIVSGYTNVAIFFSIISAIIVFMTPHRLWIYRNYAYSPILYYIPHKIDHTSKGDLTEYAPRIASGACLESNPLRPYNRGPFHVNISHAILNSLFVVRFYELLLVTVVLTTDTIRGLSNTIGLSNKARARR